MPTSLFRVEKVLQTIRTLSAEIGPRCSTSAAERQASRYVAERLCTARYDVEIEPFHSVNSFSWAFGGFFALFLLVVILLAKKSKKHAILQSRLSHGGWRRIEGSWRHIFIKNGPYFLSDRKVYADGMIDC